MLKISAALLALAFACSSAQALPLPDAAKILSQANYCSKILISTNSSRIRVAQMSCRRTGGTAAAPICGGSCDYNLCGVQQDAQGRPTCGCGG